MNAPSKHQSGVFAVAEQRNGGQFDIEGFGLRARVRGHDIIVVVLIVLLFAAVGFLVWDHDQKTAARIEILTTGQQQVIEEVAALTYVMTLTAEEKSKLTLSMPESLRKKLRAER